MTLQRIVGVAMLMLGIAAIGAIRLSPLATIEETQISQAWVHTAEGLTFMIWINLSLMTKFGMILNSRERYYMDLHFFSFLSGATFVLLVSLLFYDQMVNDYAQQTLTFQPAILAFIWIGCWALTDLFFIKPFYPFKKTSLKSA